MKGVWLGFLVLISMLLGSTLKAVTCSDQLIQVLKPVWLRELSRDPQTPYQIKAMAQGLADSSQKEPIEVWVTLAEKKQTDISPLVLLHLGAEARGIFVNRVLSTDLRSHFLYRLVG